MQEVLVRVRHHLLGRGPSTGRTLDPIENAVCCILVFWTVTYHIPMSVEGKKTL